MGYNVHCRYIYIYIDRSERDSFGNNNNCSTDTAILIRRRRHFYNHQRCRHRRRLSGCLNLSAPPSLVHPHRTKVYTIYTYTRTSTAGGAIRI